MSSSEREQLASCPFCGDVPTTIEADETQGYKWGRVRCCIQGPEVRTGYDTSSNAAWHAEAIAAWNRRAQASAEPVAWMHEDDCARVISAIQKAGALKDGGASATSLRPYSVRLYAAPQRAIEVAALTVEVETLRGLVGEMLDLSDNWPGIAYSYDLEQRARAAAAMAPSEGREG